ncbi:hypothetical protein WN943_001459 [Citrus x changshan-huyou]
MPFLVIVYFRNAQESNLTFLLRNLGGRFKLNQWPKDVVCTIRLAGLALIRLFPLLLEIGILVTPLLMISSLLLFKFQVVVLPS